MLSKNTPNAAIEALSQLVKEDIASHVRKSEMYSVEIDTTQDVTCKDQCSVILQYVTKQIMRN